MSAPENAKLVVLMSDGKVQEHELGDQVMHIGRDASCEIQIPSIFVSRRHAMITPIEDRFVIQDERSTNGLQINGQLVREPHPLSSGDRVVLGDVTLTYEEISDDPFATAVYGMSPSLAGVAGPDVRHQGTATSQMAEESRRRTRPAGLWSILFTDLVDHTRQVTRLGDVAGQRWLRTHIDILRKQFVEYDGLEDKWTGDGFLVTFDSSRRAIQCAVAIQRALRDHNRDHPTAEIHVRAGLNTGEVLKEEEELFGNAVILASRVMSKAGADEIMISELMYRLVQATGEFAIAERGMFVLKGFPQRQRLYEIKWRETDQHTLTGS